MAYQVKAWLVKGATCDECHEQQNETPALAIVVPGQAQRTTCVACIVKHYDEAQQGAAHSDLAAVVTPIVSKAIEDATLPILTALAEISKKLPKPEAKPKSKPAPVASDGDSKSPVARVDVLAEAPQVQEIARRGGRR